MACEIFGQLLLLVLWHWRDLNVELLRYGMSTRGSRAARAAANALRTATRAWRLAASALCLLEWDMISCPCSHFAEKVLLDYST